MEEFYFNNQLSGLCKRSLFWLSIGFVLLFSSCKTIYYVPSIQNVPMIQEKGEINADLGATTNLNQSSLQFAYGITDHIAVQANGSLFSPSFWLTTESNYSGGMADGGVGYFRKFGNGFLFDTYLLGGYGEVDNFNLEYPDDTSLKLRFSRWAVQPSVSYIMNKYFSVSGSVRTGVLFYHSLEFDRARAVDPMIDSYFDRHRNTFYVLEPALTMRVGFEHFKVKFQYQYSFNLTDSDFPQVRDVLSIGLQIHY